MDVIIRNSKESDYEEVKELLVDLIRQQAGYTPLRRKEPASEYKEWYFQRALSYVEQGLGIIGVAEID